MHDALKSGNVKLVLDHVKKKQDCSLTIEQLFDKVVLLTKSDSLSYDSDLKEYLLYILDKCEFRDQEQAGFNYNEIYAGSTLANLARLSQKDASGVLHEPIAKLIEKSFDNGYKFSAQTDGYISQLSLSAEIKEILKKFDII